MYSKYGFLGLLKLVISISYTRIFFKNSRIIRLPIDIRFKCNIDFGNNLTTGSNCRFESVGEKSKVKRLIFGNNVQINDFVHITAHENVTIGNNVLIASKVYISDVAHGDYNGVVQSSPLNIPADRILITKPVIIEDNVWIGEGVCILPGVKVGFGAIIGSNSVVTKDVPPFSISVGVPAKVIKVYDEISRVWVSK